ncbi:LOW QUALITY PROTEIN: hypothetical protein Bca4012_034039 [Brassica carinata]
MAASTYQTIPPPPPKLCGSPVAPSQQELSSEAGRHLAYKEYGVLRDKAICKIVFVHGSDSCRHDNAFTALL